MSVTIASDRSVADMLSAIIAGTAKSIILSRLSIKDNESTITANINSNRVYAFNQSSSVALSRDLETAANNIRAAADSFESFDNSR